MLGWSYYLIFEQIEKLGRKERSVGDGSVVISFEEMVKEIRVTFGVDLMLKSVFAAGGIEFRSSFKRFI